VLDVDLTDLDLFAHGFPHDVFVRHRADAPVLWHEPTAHTPDGRGFWSVATYAETMAVISDPATFSSERGGTLIQDLDLAGAVLSMMDDPRHGRIRRLVSSGLTPRTVRRLEDELRRRTIGLLDALDTSAPVDFLVAVAAELPMQAICILLGVPEADRYALWEAVDPGFDVRAGDAAFATGGSSLFDYAAALIEEKRAHPTDDMLSIVVHATLADVDPPQLTELELLSFFSLLFAAGSETTRNAIAGGLLALIDRPAQLHRLRGDVDALLPAAIEEMLRWTTPSPSKRRTATRDCTVAGCSIAGGDKVVYWEASANRDEQVFIDSMAVAIDRAPNPHLALGHGVHYCLGANLARLEMRVVFEELLPRFAGYELAGDPEWTRSNRHTGLRHLPVALSRTSPTA
jgi:cytochrome P450